MQEISQMQQQCNNHHHHSYQIEEEDVNMSSAGVNGKVMKFMYVHTKDSNFLYVSKEVVDVLGVKQEALIDRSYEEFLYGSDDIVRARECTNRTLMKGETEECVDVATLSPYSYNRASQLEKKEKLLMNIYQVSFKDFRSMTSLGNGLVPKEIPVRVYERPIVKLCDGVPTVIGVQGVCVMSETISKFEQEYGSLLLWKSRLQYCLEAPGSSTAQQETTVNETVENITILYENKLQFHNTEGDKWLEIGRDLFKKQVHFYVIRNLTVQFVLPAFPFKSRNKEKKVLGHLPDKGEELALNTLHSFLKDVYKIYEKGANLTIISDGRVFADVFSIEEYKVTEYDNELRTMFPENAECISWLDLEYFFECETHDMAREKVVRLFAQSEKQIEESIKNDEDYRKMYCGFSRFVKEDLFSVLIDERKQDHSGGLTLTQMKKQCKVIAKKILKRNAAYSSLVETLFPLHIRLSIHAHNNAGPKFAIRLLPFEKTSEKLVADKNMHIPTPWHNVVVEDRDGKYFLIKRYKVETLGDKYELVISEKTGRPSHYRQLPCN